MAQLEMLEEEILPAAVLAGAFGDDAELVKCDTQEDSRGEDQFASIVMYSSLKIKRKNKTEKLWLVIKFNQESKAFRESVTTDTQLLNEVFMYDNLLPYLGIDEELIPKFYYGVATGGKSPELDVLILQDLSRDGYQVRKDSLSLDYNRVVLALRQLARFHAASFVNKQKHEERFYEKVEMLKEAQWINDKLEGLNASLKPVLIKVVQALISKNENVQIFQSLLEKISAPYSYIKELLEPTEPLSVVCHGDFQKSNILYKYDEDGVAVDAKFVDFGTARYTSPVVDLAYFLFSNTTSVARRAHLDDFLTEYYDVLKSSSGDVHVPQIELFEQEFHTKAVYGFFDCCIHIPAAFSEPYDWEELATLTPDQLWQFHWQRCGEEATALLCNVLRDLVHFKCRL